MKDYMEEARKTIEDLKQSTQNLSDKLDHVINMFKQNREMIKNAVRDGGDRTFMSR